MRKILYIFLTIIIIIGGIVFLGIKEKPEIKAAAGPICAMKTKIDGYFYVPILNPQSLKVVLLFDDPNIQGDQTGTSGEVYPYWPDGNVNLYDAVLVNGRYGQNEGDPGWEYMADINPNKKVDIYDAVTVNANYGNSGTYTDVIEDIDPTTVSIEFFDAGGVSLGEFNLDSEGRCNIPADAVEFWVEEDIDGDTIYEPIGAYILFYAAPGAAWPHISITAPASVTVNEEFSVSLTYTHDAAEVGGIHLRWQDSEFDVTDAAGCAIYDDPLFAPGWEGIECYLLNSGTTTTFTLRALTVGTQTLYYRAWDETKDYDCGDGTFDHNRDPDWSSCTPECDPAEFPERWEECHAHSQDITVSAACTRTNPTVTLSPATQSGSPGETLIYTISVTNNDTAACGASDFPLSTTGCPAGGWICALGGSFPGPINPGETDSSRTVSVTSPATASPGNYTVSVTAINNSDPAYFGTGAATYTVALICADAGGNCMRPADCFGIPPAGSHICNADPFDCIAPDGCCCVLQVCVPDGCNANCPAACTVNEDPDCGCQDGDGCCGIGCNNANDDDCSLKIEAPDCPTYCSDQNIYDPPSGFICICSLTKWEKFEKLIGGIIDFIFWAAIAIVPIMIIIAAFYFLTSAGDPEKVRKAKSIIFWTIIGFAIVLLAKGIISVIKQIIGG